MYQLLSLHHLSLQKLWLHFQRAQHFKAFLLKFEEGDYFLVCFQLILQEHQNLQVNSTHLWEMWNSEPVDNDKMLSSISTYQHKTIQFYYLHLLKLYHPQVHPLLILQHLSNHLIFILNQEQDLFCQYLCKFTQPHQIYHSKLQFQLFVFVYRPCFLIFGLIGVRNSLEVWQELR